MIEINGKVYRNLQEQVEKNKDDIEELKEHGTGETYTAGTGINISDENVISIDNTVATKEDINTYTAGYGLTFGETNEFEIDSTVVATKSDILEYESGDGILITTSGENLRQISVSTDVAMTDDIPTKVSQLDNDSDFITIADVPVPTAGTGIDILNGQISVDNTVAMKTDIPNTYTKTQIENMDSTTLAMANAYTDNKVIAGASVYEYELIFDDSDNEDTWFYRFISTDPGLINTSVPESYAELVQFVKDHGILYANSYRMIGYAMDNGTIYYSHLYYNSLANWLKVTFPGRSDQTIDANNLIVNSITLKKRTC